MIVSNGLTPIVLVAAVALAIVDFASGATTRNRISNIPVEKKKKSLCDRLHPEELPQECICRESAGNLHVVVDCIKPFNSTYFNDTIGMSMDIDICNEQGSSVAIDVTEKPLKIETSVTAPHPLNRLTIENTLRGLYLLYTSCKVSHMDAQRRHMAPGIER